MLVVKSMDLFHSECFFASAASLSISRWASLIWIVHAPVVNIIPNMNVAFLEKTICSTSIGSSMIAAVMELDHGAAPAVVLMRRARGLKLAQIKIGICCIERILALIQVVVASRNRCADRIRHRCRTEKR